MGLILPGIRTRQPSQAPRANWANPITKGMIAACIPHLRVEVVNNGGPVQTGAFAVSAAPSGMGLLTNGSNNNLYFKIPQVVLTQWTIFGQFRSNSAGVDVRAMNLAWSGSDNPYIPIGTGNSNAGKVRVLASTTAGGLPANQESVAVCFDGTPHTIALSYDGSNVRCYIDGILDTTASTSAGASWTIDLINFGCLQRSSGVAFWPGLGFVGIAHKRALSDIEIRSLHINPQQVFDTPQRRLLVDAAAVGPVNATGTLVSTLDDAVFAASGIILNAGAFASTLGNATMAASGTVGAAPSGTLASTLGDATMSSAGAVTNAGSFAATLGNATMAASGFVINQGALAATLGNAILSAAGTVAPHATGTFSSTLDGATMAAYGYNGVPPVLAGLFQRLPKNPRHVQRIP